MVSLDHPLIHLLRLIDLVWVEAEGQKRGRGAPKVYSERVMFKMDVVSLSGQALVGTTRTVAVFAGDPNHRKRLWAGAIA